MTRPDNACVLCGSETEDTAMALIEWREPIAGERYSHVPRCLDRAGCRSRVELVVKEPWPVADRTPAPRPRVELAPEPSNTATVAEAAVSPWRQ